MRLGKVGRRPKARRKFLMILMLIPGLSWVSPHHFSSAPLSKFNPLTISGKIPGFARSVYDSLNLSDLGLSRTVYETALKGLERLRSLGRLTHDNILSIVDFSQPSSNKRFYVIDLLNGKLLFNTYVAHGRHSGKEFATRFSNRPRSLESSVGFYLTAQTYMGSNGYSLKLQGMEYGFNSNAAKREIVLHGADYVSEQYIASNGFLGRSWGCPAVPLEQSHDIIDNIKEGSCLFIYSPQPFYLKSSRLLNGRS